MMVLLDSRIKDNTDMTRFNEWFNKIKGMCPPNKLNEIFYPKEYALFKRIYYLVSNLCDEKLGNCYKYNKERPDIENLISNSVAMTMFYLKEDKDFLRLINSL